MQTISATDLARNTRRILDAVAGQGETVVIERNQVPIARILPPESTMTARQALAGFQPRLTSRQAEDWLKASRNTHDRSAFEEGVSDPWA